MQHLILQTKQETAVSSKEKENHIQTALNPYTVLIITIYSTHTTQKYHKKNFKKQKRISLQ